MTVRSVVKRSVVKPLKFEELRPFGPNSLESHHFARAFRQSVTNRAQRAQDQAHLRFRRRRRTLVRAR